MTRNAGSRDPASHGCGRGAERPDGEAVKIHVTTDDGVLIETFDSQSEDGAPDASAQSPWGDLSKPIPRAAMIADLRRACDLARRDAIKAATGGET